MSMEEMFKDDKKGDVEIMVVEVMMTTWMLSVALIFVA